MPAVTRCWIPAVLVIAFVTGGAASSAPIVERDTTQLRELAGQSAFAAKRSGKLTSTRRHTSSVVLAIVPASIELAPPPRPWTRVRFAILDHVAAAQPVIACARAPPHG